MALVQDFYSVVNFYLTLQGKQEEIDNYTLHHSNSSLQLICELMLPHLLFTTNFFKHKWCSVQCSACAARSSAEEKWGCGVEMVDLFKFQREREFFLISISAEPTFYIFNRNMKSLCALAMTNLMTNDTMRIVYQFFSNSNSD